MTDHAALADVVVRPAFGGPSDPGPRQAIDDHLATCTACRATLNGIRADASAIAAFSAGAPSAWVEQAVLRAAQPTTRLTGMGRILIFALLAIGAIGGGVAGAGALVGLQETSGTPPPPPDVAALVAGKPIVWRVDSALLAADDITIQANGRTLHPGQAKTQLHGDPGSLTSSTLEVTWIEGDIEQRMDLYFEADAVAWTVREVRAYDNLPQPDWAFLDHQVGRIPLGQPFLGDLRFTGQGRAGPVELVIRGAVLMMDPHPNFVDPPGGQRLTGDPFAAGGRLHCSGILQLSPIDAERELQKHGVRLSWRFNSKTGPNTGFADLRLRAPASGWISGTAIGSSGELIVFVEDPTKPMQSQVPFPRDCPPPSGP